MSKTEKPISITVMGKEYLVTCDERERGLIDDAVTLLNEKIEDIKSTGKTIGGERISVLAALNIAHEMLSYKRVKEGYTTDVDNMIRRLKCKVDGVLTEKQDLAAEKIGDIE